MGTLAEASGEVFRGDDLCSAMVAETQQTTFVAGYEEVGFSGGAHCEQEIAGWIG